jgi:hypothetical protein
MVQLGYPSYFKPYGFYFSPSQIEDGFWYEDFLTLDVLYYIYDGRIRQGEHVVLDSIYVTSHGDYNVEIDTYVEKPESIAAPMRKLLYDENLNNGEVCRLETDPYPSCADEFSLSAFDTTFTDCYSIIKTVTMTMIGSGVEYGERTTTYLARGLGVVNEKVEVRWSERIGFDGEDWSNYSELKLNDFRHIGSDLGRSKGILEELIGQKKINIEQLDQLDGDPFIKGRSTGIQSIRLPSNY